VTSALAESPAPVPQAPADAGSSVITLDKIEVISQEINAARLKISFKNSISALGRQRNFA
jgi:hypothetical protein